MASDERYEIGANVRRKVLGDAHVDRVQERANAFDEVFQHYITEAVWGSVWSRPQLDQRTRSLLTIALLGALGHYEELEMHVKAASNTGAEPSEIAEALLNVAVYAGVPAGNQAFSAAKRALAAAESREVTD